MPRETTSISLEIELMQWLDALAEKQNRTRSNVIETFLKEIYEALDARQPAPQVDEVPA